MLVGMEGSAERLVVILLLKTKLVAIQHSTPGHRASIIGRSVVNSFPADHRVRTISADEYPCQNDLLRLLTILLRCHLKAKPH